MLSAETWFPKSHGPSHLSPHCDSLFHPTSVPRTLVWHKLPSLVSLSGYLSISMSQAPTPTTQEVTAGVAFLPPVPVCYPSKLPTANNVGFCPLLTLFERQELHALLQIAQAA